MRSPRILQRRKRREPLPHLQASPDGAIPMKKLYMETTAIDPGKTAGEITSELVRAGATSINTDYRGGNISGLRWVMQINGQDAVFDMPVRVDPVFKLLNGRRSSGRSGAASRDMKQAHRVALRQLLRWVQAQNAMIQTGMVEAVEVYLPYMVIPGMERTLFQKMAETQFRALPAPEKPQ